MRIGKFCVRTRHLRLIQVRPFSWLTTPYGWSLCILAVTISWIDQRKMLDELDKAFSGLPE